LRARFVFVFVPFDHYWENIVLGAQGGRDLWAQAEEFIAKKARGELEGGLLPNLDQ
jgi:hypothetical protein